MSSAYTLDPETLECVLAIMTGASRNLARKNLSGSEAYANINRALKVLQNYAKTIENDTLAEVTYQ